MTQQRSVLLCEAVLSLEHFEQHVMRHGVKGFHNVDEDDVCVASLHRGESSSRAFSARRHLHQGDHMGGRLFAAQVADLFAFDETMFQEVA